MQSAQLVLAARALADSHPLLERVQQFQMRATEDGGPVDLLPVQLAEQFGSVGQRTMLARTSARNASTTFG